MIGRAAGACALAASAGASLRAHVPGPAQWQTARAEWRRVLRDSVFRARAEAFDYGKVDPGAAPQVRGSPSAVPRADGRPWLSTGSSLAWVDVAHTRNHGVSPSVRVRGLRAGGPWDPRSWRVTPRTTALDIAYTASALVHHGGTRSGQWRAGVDTARQDAGTQREVFRSHLGTGSHPSRAPAANGDGVWSTAGTAREVATPPTLVRTRVLLALCAAVGVLALYALLLRRHLRVARALSERYYATIVERLRVARDLHDTLLGDMAGITMRLDAATRARTRDADDTALLADLRDHARRTFVETRRAVSEMRASSARLVPVCPRLADAARRVFAGTGVVSRVEHTGRHRRYPAAVEAEVLRIATEAMTNVRQHANSRTVTVTCAYTSRELRVRVRDGGRGFDPGRAAPDGHYGLVDMRERAAAIGARLTVDSVPGRGTDVCLVLRHPGLGRST